MTNAIIAAASASASATITTIPEKEELFNVHINEIRDQITINIVNSYPSIPAALQTEIIGHKGKHFVFDKYNKVGSFEIKCKEECKSTDVLYYVFVFKAIRDVLSKKKENGKSKMPLFYKDNYVLVFSRRGNCFPEKDDYVIIRSDLKNKTNSTMKPQLYKRKFCEVRDNCNFIGRLTCRFTATVIGKTHVVGNSNETISVYGIPVSCNKIDQSSRVADDASRMKNYNVIWLDYDEKEAAVGAYKDLDVVVYGKIFLPCDQEQRYIPSSPVSAATATATQPVMHAISAVTTANTAEEKEEEGEGEGEEEEGESDDEVIELEAGFPVVSAVQQQQEQEQDEEMVDEDADRRYTIEFCGETFTLLKLDDRVTSRFIEDSPAESYKRDRDYYEEFDDDDNVDFCLPPAKRACF